MAEIAYSVVEEEEDQISMVEMMGTTMEAIIGITTKEAPMTANGVITTTAMENRAVTITTTNGAIIIIIRAPQEPGNKPNVLDAQPAVMDLETNPEVVATVGPFLTRFNGVHLNMLMNIQVRISRK